ncbi:MAG: DUF2807 domain-containing protein [Bacteroidota bacterium]|nr:DUF2807 domain-containing protein [Bacteroidota bacterium]
MGEIKSTNKISILLLVIFILLSGFLILPGCNKEGVCISSTGPIKREPRKISDFDSLDVRGNVNVFLHQDTINRVMVEAGENLLPGIVTEVENRQLTINNFNTCNWVRSYSKPINVYVSVKNLIKIYYLSSGDITATDTLRSDSLHVEAWGGCGVIDLLMKTGSGQFILQMGTVDYKLRGICPITSIYAGDYGLFDCRNLKSSYTYVTNKGSNDCYVYSNYFLEATIGSIGNIYYTGNPLVIKTHIEGTGQLIPF